MSKIEDHIVDEHNAEDIQPKSTSRRNYVISGISAASLAACGGGGAEDPESKDETTASTLEKSVIIVKEKLGYPLLDISTSKRELWWIEIVHRRGGQSEVQFSESHLYVPELKGRRWKTISKRAVIGSNSGHDHHAVNFATLDTGPTANGLTTLSTFKHSARIQVLFKKSKTVVSRTVGAGGSYTYPFALKIKHSTDEVEWLFANGYQATKKEWDVAVRFFRASANDTKSIRKNFITEIAKFAPYYDVGDDRDTATPPNIIHTSLPIANDKVNHHKCRVIPYSNGDQADSLVLKNVRYDGISEGEIVKPLCAKFSSSHERRHTHRRIERHISNFVKVLHEDKNLKDEDRQKILDNELHSIMFGNTLSKKFNSVRDKIEDNIKKNFTPKSNSKDGDRIRDGLKSIVGELDLESEGKRYLQNAAADFKSGNGDLGIAYTSNLQLLYSTPQLSPIFLKALGLGVGFTLRASLPLFSGTGFYDSNKKFSSNFYTPFNGDFVNYSFTVAGSIGNNIDIPEASWKFWKGWSVAFEVTVYLKSYFGKGTRVDRIKVDLVADMQATTLLSKLFIALASSFSWVAKKFGITTKKVLPRDVPTIEMSRLETVRQNIALGGHTELLLDMSGVLHIEDVGTQVKHYEQLGKDLFDLAKDKKAWDLCKTTHSLYEFGLVANIYNNLSFKSDFQTGWSAGTGGSVSFAAKDLHGIGIATKTPLGNIGARFFNSATVYASGGKRLYEGTP